MHLCTLGQGPVAHPLKGSTGMSGELEGAAFPPGSINAIRAAAMKRRAPGAAPLPAAALRTPLASAAPAPTPKLAAGMTQEGIDAAIATLRANMAAKKAGLPVPAVASKPSRPQWFQDAVPQSAEKEAENDTTSSSSKAEIALQVRTADEARKDLVEQWREICKPRKQPTPAKKPCGCKVDFPILFAEWCEQRGLSDALERVEDQRGWMVYRFKNSIVESEPHWEQAFHGTWWYPLWVILNSGVMLESNDHSLGHDFWEPGVYCSPKLETGRWYARPQVLFGDGAYHRIILELRVDPARRKKERQRGGVQWVFNTSAVAIHGIWVQVNNPPVKGEERINDWVPELEAMPPGGTPLPNIVNPRPNGPWPDVEDDEEVMAIPHLGVHSKIPAAKASVKGPAAVVSSALSKSSAGQASQAAPKKPAGQKPGRVQPTEEWLDPFWGMDGGDDGSWQAQQLAWVLEEALQWQWGQAPGMRNVRRRMNAW